MSYTTNSAFLNYGEARAQNCMGYAMVAYKDHRNPSTDIHRAFIANSCGDGWFRRDDMCGNSSRIGLGIAHVTMSRAQPKLVGDYLVYKAKIDFVDFDELWKQDEFWIYVHRKFELQDVLEYIRHNQHNWRP